MISLVSQASVLMPSLTCLLVEILKRNEDKINGGVVSIKAIEVATIKGQI